MAGILTDPQRDYLALGGIVLTAISTVAAVLTVPKKSIPVREGLLPAPTPTIHDKVDVSTSPFRRALIVFVIFVPILIVPIMITATEKTIMPSTYLVYWIGIGTGLQMLLVDWNLFKAWRQSKRPYAFLAAFGLMFLFSILGIAYSSSELFMRYTSDYGGGLLIYDMFMACGWALILVVCWAITLWRLLRASI
jgi:hypothetical protein